MSRTGIATTTLLHAAVRPGISLDQALRQAPRGGIALLSTPRHYHVARMENGRPHLRGDTPVPLGDVFEARIFDGTSELRWLHTAAGHGQAVLLTEDDTALPEDFDERIEPVSAADTSRGEYLLWGRVAACRDGWATLATARIGTFDVPVPADIGARIRLVTREYVAHEAEHGNAHIAEERLLRLEPVPTTNTRAEDTAS
jgi:CRISPR-associated protein (TIGR03984 family)